MRKDILIKRTTIALISVWVLLTSYKVLRKYVQARKPAEGPGYYTMPKTKEERKHELGRSTWTLLHNIAAKHPAQPTREQQTNIIKFIDLITKLFPCEECRGHFKKLVDSFPPKVSSQEELSLWMCQAHNIVNKRIGKPQFDCNRLDDRWDCGCK